MIEQKEIKAINVSDAEVYRMLKLPECPYSLPTARSMTQAKIDFDSIKDQVIAWHNSLTSTNTKDGK